MANKKISAVTPDGTPTTDDVIVTVDATSGLNKKVTLGDVGLLSLEDTGVWQTWTSPINLNLNVGTTGTVNAKYAQVGKTVICKFEAVLGGTGISVGDVYLNLPVTAAAYSNSSVIGTGCAIDNTATTAVLTTRIMTTTTLRVLILNASGTYVGLTGMTSTVPHTWASPDQILVYLHYEAAA